MTNNKRVRVQLGQDNKVSATDMVIGLVRSGVPLTNIALYSMMSAEDQAFVRIALNEK